MAYLLEREQCLPGACTVSWGTWQAGIAWDRRTTITPEGKGEVQPSRC